MAKEHASLISRLSVIKGISSFAQILLFRFLFCVFFAVWFAFVGIGRVIGYKGCCQTCQCASLSLNSFSLTVFVNYCPTDEFCPFAAS